MKVDTTKLMLFILVLIMGYNSFFKGVEVSEPAPVTVNLPESYGTTGLQQMEPQVVVVQVPSYGNSNKVVDVDKVWRDAYDKASQDIKDSLYIEAIRIQKYSDTLVDNDDIYIKGDVTTRGSMLDFKVDYKIKERGLTYVPETVVQYPKLSLGVGAELGVPTVLGDRFTLKGNLRFMNQKGSEVSLGYDTNKNIWLGYTHRFKIIK